MVLCREIAYYLWTRIMTVGRVSSGGGGGGTGRSFFPPNSLASPSKTLALIKLSITIGQQFKPLTFFSSKNYLKQSGAIKEILSRNLACYERPLLYHASTPNIYIAHTHQGFIQRQMFI
jgi:hypothetical protein